MSSARHAVGAALLGCAALLAQPAAAQESAAGTEARPSPLSAEVGVRLYSRAFHYTGTEAFGGASPALDNLDLPAGPMPLLHAQWFPGAHFTNNALAHIGLNAGYEQGFGTRVAATDDQGNQLHFGQTHYLYYAGLRGRLPVGLATFGAFANVGQHNYSLRDTGQGDPAALFPNLRYTYIEPGLDAEIRVAHVILGARASFLGVLSLGGIEDPQWFENARGFGVSYGGHVGFSLSRYFDILARVDARLYGLNFNPVQPLPDGPIAGGATDRYLSAALSLRVNWPAQEAKAPAAADQAPSKPDSEDDGFDSFDSFE